MRRFQKLTLLITFAIPLGCAARAAPRKQAWGYALNGELRAKKEAYWRRKFSEISVLSFASFRLSDRNLKADIEPNSTILALARKYAVRLYPLVTLKNSLEGKKILASETRTAAAIERISILAANFDGVHIDFEFMPGEYGPAYRNFLIRLKKAIGAKTLSVAVVPPIYHDVAATKFNSLDVISVADEIVFMMYDLHYPTGPAGPVTSLKWAEDNLRLLQANRFPLSRSWLGTPLYGYAWRGKKKAHVITRRFAESEKNISHPHESGCLKINPSSNEVWFVAGQTIDAGFGKLTAEYGLKGQAYWRLGFE